MKLKEFKPKTKKMKLGIKDRNGKMLYEDELIGKRWEEYIGKELYNDERKSTSDIEEVKEKKDK